MSREGTPGLGRLLAVAGGVLLVVGGGALAVFRATLRESVAEPHQDVRPLEGVGVDAGAPIATVLSVRGAADRERAGAWAPLRSGDVLSAQDTVRTAVSGGVDLQIGDERSRISVAGGTTLEMKELSNELHRFGLAKGRLTADYAEEGGRALRIEGAGGAVASTRGARFTVLSSGTAVAVATERGEAGLASAGQVVRISAGSQSVARVGAAPSAAVPIPREVLLRVAKLAAGPALCARVRGVVRPGSQVRVGDEEAVVLADGTFEVAVPRVAGLAGVKVAVVEPSGLSREQLIACRTPSARPDHPDEPTDVQIDWSAQ